MLNILPEEMLGWISQRNRIECQVECLKKYQVEYLWIHKYKIECQIKCDITIKIYEYVLLKKQTKSWKEGQKNTKWNGCIRKSWLNIYISYQLVFEIGVDSSGWKIEIAWKHQLDATFQFVYHNLPIPLIHIIFVYTIPCTR